MSALKQGTRPLKALRGNGRDHQDFTSAIRTFSSSATHRDEASAEANTSNSTKRQILEPHLVHTPRLERRLLRLKNATPISSRRRRAALQSGEQTPFAELPYQCFQEARKVLQADRQEKMKQIETQRARLERVKALKVEPQNEHGKERRLISLEAALEELKVHADVNDAMVKRIFEDGKGNMNKPIYRHLADKKWRSYGRALLMQRITQMNVVPDILPAVDPTVSVDLAFGSRNVQPGEFVDSRVSEIPAKLNIQPYTRGSRLVTIAIVNPDVPVVSKDGFDYRCHFLASNIEITPTATSVPLAMLSQDSQVIMPWLPAYSQKGAPYNRMSIFVLEQPNGQVDIASARKRYEREGFVLRSFADKFRLHTIGVNLYRTKWDEGTAGVMQRAGVPGHDVEFKRMKVEPLPYKKLPGSRYR